MKPRRKLISSAIFAAITSMSAAAAHAQLTGETGAHDPSTLIKDGSNYYYFATGQGIVSRMSTDRVNWIAAPSVFATQPAWTTNAVPGFTGNFWAPDIAYFNGQYHLYYSASSWGSINSAIGHATSPSLTNPSWTDQGKLIQSDPAGSTHPQTDTTAFNAIDPSVFVDNSTGKVWMSWGSYFSGIAVTELNPATGQRLNPNALSATLVANNAPGGGGGSSIEGSALTKHGSYYYLFVNYGTCCSSVDSTYNIRVGRSTSPTGPFLDKNGVDMRNGGGTMFLDDDGKLIGPGHFSFFSENGQDTFGYHYYNGDADGAPTYNVHNLYWTAAAWPSYVAVNPDWTGATNGGWSTATNWSDGTVPNGVGHAANFDSNAAARYTLSLDGSGRTVGSINFRGTAGYTIGAVAGPTLTLDADPGYAATINVAAGNHTIAAPISAIDNIGVNVTPAGSTLTFSSSVSAPGLTKYGHGTLLLTGVNTYTGSVLDRWGTLDITGSVIAGKYTSIGTIVGENAVMNLRVGGHFTANADFNVGDTGSSSTPATGALNLSGNASLTINPGGGFFVGSGIATNSRAVGTVNQTGGLITANGNFDGAFVIGGRNSALASGTYNLSGGVVNANTNLRVGGYGTGTINQTAGTFNVNGYASVGRFAGATGIWNLSGGTLNQTAAGPTLIIGEGGNGTLAVSGAGVVTTSSPLRIGLNTGSVGIVNLNGGTLTVPSISRGTGSATLNFNGGTLRATANAPALVAGLTAANVLAGGALLDTQGFAVTVAQPLLHGAAGPATDGGVIKLGTGSLTLAGANTYTGTTIIRAGILVARQPALALIIAGPSGADVTGGQLVLDYTGGLSPAPQVNAALAAGFSQAVSFSSGPLRDTSLAAGQRLGWIDDGVTVTISPTVPGDSNLDHSVDFADLLTLAQNYNSNGKVWSDGDFNYDGNVDFSDLLSLSQNYGATMTGSFEGDWELARALVPEPLVPSTLVVVAAAALRRIRL